MSCTTFLAIIANLQFPKKIIFTDVRTLCYYTTVLAAIANLIDILPNFIVTAVNSVLPNFD